MNKQFIISVVVLFIVTMILGFIVHGQLLNEAYQASGMFRSDEDSQNYFHYMLLAHLFMAIGLTWVYRMGTQDKPWLQQGIRFGLAIAVLITIPTYMIYYAVQPLPAALVHQQLIYDSIAMVLVGITAAFVNK
jgi:uncharacterized BrkB/YihY/UPF0761 family membrane protein